jgi:hypothetical protein
MQTNIHAEIQIYYGGRRLKEKEWKKRRLAGANEYTYPHTNKRYTLYSGGRK